VGLIDETGHPKSGSKTCGVQRQWCGATGKIDNCVVTVHLGYSTAESQFRCLVDGAVYVPKSWADDPQRRAEAGLPESLGYRPKWQIALDLIARALSNGVRFGYLTFDEEYGKVPAFLHRLDTMGQRYVAEVPAGFRGWLLEPTVLQRGRYRGRGRPLRYPRLSAKSTPDNAVDRLCRWSYPMRDQPWQTFHVKDGTKGPIVWEAKAARFRMKLPGPGQRRGQGHGTPSAPLWLIVARNVLTGELKYFVSNAPAGTPLEELLRVAFSRWHVERCFQDEKGQLGLDHFECRRYVAIRRHLVITAISHLFLAEARLRLREAGEKRTHDPAIAARRGRLDRCRLDAPHGRQESPASRVALHSPNARAKPKGRPVPPANPTPKTAEARD
jgi:SRSO17 transposase